MGANTLTANRVLIVAPEPYYTDRGTPIAVKHVIQALTEFGSHVDLLTYPIGKEFEWPGLRTFRVPNLLKIQQVPIGFSFRKVLLDTILIPAIWKRLSSDSYSCIHALEESAYPAVIAGRRMKIPVVYDMQSSLPEQLRGYPIFQGSAVQKMLHLCERWLIRNADLVVCSAGLEDYVRQIDPCARVMEWIFPGHQGRVEAKEVNRLREDLKIAPDSQVVVYTGNFESYQELPKLIDAAMKTRAYHPKTVFVLVGVNDSDGFASSGQAKILLEQGALRLVPCQARSQISKYLGLANVLVSPRGEGRNLPLKIFDYLAAGRPIVAIDSPTNRTVLDNKRAVLVDPSTNGLGEAITQLLQDPEKSKCLGAAARVYADEHLGWKAFVELVSQVQARAVGPGRQARCPE